MERFPYEESHELLQLAYRELSSESFSIEQHNEVWQEFYPPKTRKAEKLLQKNCLGHKVTAEEIEEAREEVKNVKSNA